jgi:hypothetical protein
MMGDRAVKPGAPNGSVVATFRPLDADAAQRGRIDRLLRRPR